MNQGRSSQRAGRMAAALGWAAWVAAGLLAAAPTARGQTMGGAAMSHRGARQPQDGPNLSNDRDLAAGALIDSLFAPSASSGSRPEARMRALGVEPSKASQRPSWSARLARNPKKGDGHPPYVLIDRYGGIQRFVEPVAGIDLESHVGQTISVRRDTGHTLLASQLELPRRAIQGDAVDSGVRLAAFEEPMPPIEPTPADGTALEESVAAPQGEIIEGEIMEGHIIEGEGPIFDESSQHMMMHDGVDPLYVDEGPNFGCTECGDGVCGGKGCLGGCGFGSRPMAYVRGQYLLWWFDGMDTPPLVVRDDDPNDPDNVATTIAGGGELLDDPRDGGRVILGYWLDDYGKLALEGDYLAFGQETFSFTAGDFDPDNVLWIFRPFFSVIEFTNNLNQVIPRGLAVEDVDTDVITGTVAVEAESEFQSAGIRMRYNLCCLPGGATGCGDGVTCGSGVGGCDSCAMPMDGSHCRKLFQSGTRHTDMLLGFRWAELDERLAVTENLVETTLGPDPGATYLVRDSFATSNQFLGGEIGYLWDWSKGRWSLEFLSKLAIGNTRQRVFIAGSTLIDNTPPAEEGGLLALGTNIGEYERDRFSVIPEIGVTAGYSLTQRLRLNVGYTLLYWSNVVRPGDQIDIDINAAQLPRAPDPSLVVEFDHPRFAFRQNDLWAHGFNVGLDYIW